MMNESCFTFSTFKPYGTFAAKSERSEHTSTQGFSVPEMTMLGLNLSMVIGLGSSLFRAGKEASVVMR